MSTKKQITIPASAKAPKDEGAAKHLSATDLDKVVGCLRYQGKPKTIAQMHAAITREIIRRHDRGRY